MTMQLKTITPTKVSNPAFDLVSSQMRSSFLFALIFFFLFLLVTLVIPPKSNGFGYFAALKDKHRRLDTLPSPKIVFVGGSNLAFGLDSSLIENTFHIPVVNMGLCAPFGLRYMLEEVKDHVNAGDTIVIVPEYGILQNTVDGGPDIIHAVEVYPTAALFILRACAASPPYIRCLTNIIFNLPAIKWKACFAIFDQMWQEGHFDSALLNSWEIGDTLETSIRYYFEKHGDYFGHFGRPNKPYGPNWEIVKSMSSEAANLLNNFNTFARQRGAQVLFLPAPIPGEYLAPNMCSTLAIANWPDKNLTMPVLAGPKRYSFAASDFYQVPYHLNPAGKNKRTLLLLEDLKPFLTRTKFN
jgi:hypothetical protein